MATITFNQTGLPAGVEDRSRSDGQAGKPVTVTTSEPGELELLWTPLDDQLATLTSVNGSTWTFEPAVGVSGSYLLRFTPASGGPKVRRVFSIRTPTRGLRKPALNELASPTASLVDSGDDKIVVSDFNEDDPADGSPFGNGNYGGWYSALIELYNTVESIPILESAGSEPATQLMLPDQTVLGLSTWPNHQLLFRDGNQVKGVDPSGLAAPRTGNNYIDLPLIPHQDNDEFNDGSAILAERGFVLTSVDYPGGPRVITDRAGPVLWHDTTAGGLTDTQYRSTIYGSKLYLQLWCAEPARAYTLLKPVTQDNQGGFFAARIEGTIIDATNEEVGIRCNRFLRLEAPVGSGQNDSIVGLQSYYGGRRYLFAQYPAAQNGGNPSPLQYAEAIDYGAFDVFATNIAPWPTGVEGGPACSCYWLQASSGYIFVERSFGNYTPAKMGFYLVPGSKSSRNGAWRIFEIDYIRRYPAFSWFGAA